MIRDVKKTANFLDKKEKNKSQEKKRRKRRSYVDLVRNIICPYMECGRCYASKHALHLHMKNKHSWVSGKALPFHPVDSENKCNLISRRLSNNQTTNYPDMLHPFPKETSDMAFKNYLNFDESFFSEMNQNDSNEILEPPHFNSNIGDFYEQDYQRRNFFDSRKSMSMQPDESTMFDEHSHQHEKMEWNDLVDRFLLENERTFSQKTNDENERNDVSSNAFTNYYLLNENDFSDQNSFIFKDLPHKRATFPDINSHYSSFMTSDGNHLESALTLSPINMLKEISGNYPLDLVDKNDFLIQTICENTKDFNWESIVL